MRRANEQSGDNTGKEAFHVPQVLITSILSIVVAMQAWILLKIVDGGERMARIEAKLEMLKP